MVMTPQPTEPEPSQEFAAEPGARAIPLGLGGLAAGIANIGGLAVTVDGVPDAARLSAGHFLGDGSWSVRPAELQGLALHPSPGRNRNCRLSVRLRKIDKDMGDAVSIGTVYVDIDGDAGRAAIAGSDGAISLRRKSPARANTPAAAKAPPQSAQPEPARRIVRPAAPAPPAATEPATRPAAPAPAPSAPPPAPLAPAPAPSAPALTPWDPAPAPSDPASSDPVPSAPAPAPLEKTSQPIPAPDTTDLGLALPDAVAAPARGSAVVQVHVASGLRVGRFGKTGRAEEVVSVRGRGPDAGRAREAARGSIVLLGQGGKRPSSR